LPLRDPGLWVLRADATAGKKQAIIQHYAQPLAFAGLWESWNKGEEPVESCTIVTTEAKDLMLELHNRELMIVSAKDFAVCFDPALQDSKELTPLLVPFGGDGLTAYPVSMRVNNPHNDDARCIEPIVAGGQADIFG
jgi:putative SOS response-associated peptidase YedK